MTREKAKSPNKHSRALADKPDARGKEKVLPGKHSNAGKRINGVRRRTGKPDHAQKISEESEEYTSTIRFIESSLGIKSYAELASNWQPLMEIWRKRLGVKL